MPMVNLATEKEPTVESYTENPYGYGTVLCLTEEQVEKLGLDKNPPPAGSKVSLRAAADVELEVVRCDEARSVSVTKQKDGEDGAEFAFKLEKAVIGFDEDAEEITSCYVVHGTGRVARVKDKGPKGDIEKTILGQLVDLAGVGSPWVELADLREAAIAQTPMTPADHVRDRREYRVNRSIEGLCKSGRLVVKGTRLAPKSAE